MQVLVVRTTLAHIPFRFSEFFCCWFYLARIYKTQDFHFGHAMSDTKTSMTVDKNTTLAYRLYFILLHSTNTRSVRTIVVFFIPLPSISLKTFVLLAPLGLAYQTEASPFPKP